MRISHKRIAEASGIVRITAFNPADSVEPVKTVSSTHPSFAAIEEGLEAGDESVWDLFNVSTGLNKRFNKITDRVAFDGTNILWDGDPVHTVLAEQLRRALEAGETNYEALAKFWEKLETNPVAHSRDQAYDWLAAHDFKITPEGDLIGYKGVYRTEDDSYRSWHASATDGPSAYVNGVALPPRVHVTQAIGDEVTMPRSEVMHDPTVACHRGLHVATHAYAGSYGDVILEVHVDPRDIVSVPTDGAGAKVRVCRYRVVAEAPVEVGGKSPVVAAAGPTVWTGVGYAGV